MGLTMHMLDVGTKLLFKYSGGNFTFGSVTDKSEDLVKVQWEDEPPNSRYFIYDDEELEDYIIKI